MANQQINLLSSFIWRKTFVLCIIRNCDWNEMFEVQKPKWNIWRSGADVNRLLGYQLSIVVWNENSKCVLGSDMIPNHLKCTTNTNLELAQQGYQKMKKKLLSILSFASKLPFLIGFDIRFCSTNMTDDWYS